MPRCCDAGCAQRVVKRAGEAGEAGGRMPAHACEGALGDSAGWHGAWGGGEGDASSWLQRGLIQAALGLGLPLEPTTVAANANATSMSPTPPPVSPAPSRAPAVATSSSPSPLGVDAARPDPTPPFATVWRHS